ncbi:hypothetical protein G7Y79_00061g093100 [Physcia stellaris]|nr:hypothetical protein G7Y79_00061g093100 [Physcia stellaris]
MTSFAHILRDLSTLSSIRSSLPSSSNLMAHDLLSLRQNLETLNIDTKSTLDVILRDYEGLLQKEYGKRTEFEVDDLWELAGFRRLLSRQSPVMGPGWDTLASIEEKGVLSVLGHVKSVDKKQEMSIERPMRPE